MNFFVECPHCRATYARAFLGAGARCGRCGKPLPQAAAPRFVDREALLHEEANLRELQHLADQVSYLIVATDTPRVDVEIQRVALRRRCHELFHDKMHVFELVYESRFRRLWEQFRGA